MTVLADNDPIILLAEQIYRLFPGHDNATVIAALAACLGVAMDRADGLGAQPPAGVVLRYELGQLAAQIIEQRATRSVTRES